MRIFLKVIDNVILEVHLENIDEQLVEVDAANVDELTQRISSYKYDIDIELGIARFFEKEDTSKPLSSFDIKHWVSNRSFGELIDMYENDEIIKPKMQREFVWDSLKCSRLIESIIMGLPIPPLFLLEIGKNKYELIDGFQRLTTVINYVRGNPWHGYVEGKRNTPSKLSKKVSFEIGGKIFSDLDPEYKRILKRSTIPLIEFKQLGPDTIDSKYLIFERINTGSEKLNQMQIRKSLAHGVFMDDLYLFSKQNDRFSELFSKGALRKDSHVEAMLRVIVMTELNYDEVSIESNGINGILNEYCERFRTNRIHEEFKGKVNKAIDKIYSIFDDKKNMFRRVEKDSEGEFSIVGNVNISILEALIGVIIVKSDSISMSDSEIFNKYCIIMNKTLRRSLDGVEDNPFTISTGQRDAIKKRFSLCEEILGV